MEKKISKWLLNGDRGSSSNRIAFVMLGNKPINKGLYKEDYPYYPSDFARCQKLIEAVPEIKDHFELMRECGEVWSRMVDNWQEMTAIYDRDKHTRKSPDLLLLMQRIINDEQ